MVLGATMRKVPEYGRPHDFEGSIGFGVESAAANYHTIVPIVTYDEGLGVINTYKSCPQNAGFAEYAGAKCYPTSRVNKIRAEFRFSLSKEALETDKTHNLRFGTMTIHSAFNETGLAEDEKSGLDLNEILELQVETTDRQMFPLYNAIDMKDGKANSNLDLEVGQEGLDTDLEIEGVVFAPNTYYDTLHYRTNGPKLRATSTGIQWHTLSRQKPYKTIFVNQMSNTKYMNPYTFLGLLITMPQGFDEFQFGKVGDTTDVIHMQCDWQYRYLEHNHEFNHSLQ